MKSLKKEIINRYPIIILILVFIFRYLLSIRFSFQYGELIFLLLLGFSLSFFYKFFKEKYTGIAVFTILTFLLLGLFPYCHYLCYSYNRNNYSFDSEYITLRVNESKQELKYYKDSTSVKELLVDLKSIDIDLLFVRELIGKKQDFGKYIFTLTQYNKEWFHLSSLPLPKNDKQGLTNKFIINNGKKKFTFEMINYNLKNELLYFLKQKNLIQNKIKSPEIFIPFSDIWLDSVTGFVFAFIKPLSTISQLIRLFQLISAYFFFHLISSWLKQSKKLNIEKK